MRILAIGDFHGKFPKKLKNKIKSVDFDLIVSPGDFCFDKELKRLFWEHSYGKDKELWEVIGKKKNRRLEKRSFNSGKKILEELNKMGEVIGVRGNWDPGDWQDIGFEKEKDINFNKFEELIKKLENIHLIDFKNYKFNNYNFVGYPRSTYPGKITNHIKERYKEEYGEEAEELIKKIKKDNEEYFKKFEKLFDKNNILISHNPPYDTKLDLLTKDPQKGEHYGSWLVKKIIKKLKPLLVISGHIHTPSKKQKIGRTLVIKIGAAMNGEAVIIDFNDKKKKVKSVEFIK
jgi:Icc-related predicted phosphoesterase